MVGFNRRFAPATKMLMNHFATIQSPKQILIRINAGQLPADHWIHDPLNGGGRLVGEGCHFVDLALYIAGCPIRKVNATAIPDPRRNASLWDNFNIELTFENSSLATIVYTSVGDPGLPKEDIQVFAGGRSATVNDFRSVELWANGRSNRKRWSQQDKGQAAEINGWAASLQNGQSPIPFYQIVNVHQACFAAIQSIQQGKTIEI
jgi:polar amino acid transport system substrate-binding protein